MTLRSALYAGEVVHERFRPKAHKLRYRVFSMLFDLDELPGLARHAPFFSYNGRGPISFHDRDHGPRDGSSLRRWVEERMRTAGISPDGGRIDILCYPRIMGYVFNPLSVYFCHRRDGTLAALLYEVHNTHGEQHCYAIPVIGESAVIQQTAEKAFYVSPFIGPTATYKFRVIPPGEATSIVIRQEADSMLLMAAAFRGIRKPFTTATVAAHLFMFPFMTLKVIMAIHWEAAKLWLKGFAIYRHAPQAATRPRGRAA